MSRLFLDANIVMDLLEERHPFCDDAALLFAEAYRKRVQFLSLPEMARILHCPEFL